MSTFKPIAINRAGVNLPYKEGQYIVATVPFTDGGTTYQAGVYVDMLGVRQQLTMQGPKGDTGATGATGATGQNGQAATLTIGQVTTGAPGSPAQVSNSGTEQNAVVNFVIPTGLDGPRGQQGAGWFHTTVASGVTVQISSLQPQLTPSVGDGVVFPNGDVRQIISVSGPTVTLGEVLFSFKGDPGIGNATLSNIDGDSTQDGFTQAAVKGIAQAKNYYNLGAFDTYVSNGDGTGTVTRKTREINKDNYSVISIGETGANRPYVMVLQGNTQLSTDSRLFANVKFIEEGYWTKPIDDYTYVAIDEGQNIVVLPAQGKNIQEVFWEGLFIQYLAPEEYHYTEQVIDKQPIHTLNQEGESWLRDEWEKGLNLIDQTKFSRLSFSTSGNSEVPGGRAVVEIRDDSNLSAPALYTISRESDYKGTFSLPTSKSYFVRIGLNGDIEDDKIGISVYLDAGTYSVSCFGNFGSNQVAFTGIMLNEGTHPYPYEPYHGNIVRQKEVPIYCTTETTSPAATIGGDWESLGSFTTSDNKTIYAWRRL